MLEFKANVSNGVLIRSVGSTVSNTKSSPMHEKNNTLLKTKYSKLFFMILLLLELKLSCPLYNYYTIAGSNSGTTGKSTGIFVIPCK